MNIFKNQAKVMQDDRIWDIYKLPFKCIVGQIYTDDFKLVADELGDDDVEIDKIVKILNESWDNHEGTYR